MYTSLKTTVEPGFSKLFKRRKSVYYCQVFTIYRVIYAMIVILVSSKKFNNAWSLLSTGLLSLGSTVVPSKKYYSTM